MSPDLCPTSFFLHQAVPTTYFIIFYGSIWEATCTESGSSTYSPVLLSVYFVCFNRALCFFPPELLLPLWLESEIFLFLFLCQGKQAIISHPILKPPIIIASQTLKTQAINRLVFKEWLLAGLLGCIELQSLIFISLKSYPHLKTYYSAPERWLTD